MRKQKAATGHVWLPPMKMDENRMAYMSVGLFSGRIYGPIFYAFGAFSLLLGVFNFPADWAQATAILALFIIGLGFVTTVGYVALKRYSVKNHPEEWAYMLVLFARSCSFKAEARRLFRLK